MYLYNIKNVVKKVTLETRDLVQILNNGNWLKSFYLLPKNTKNACFKGQIKWYELPNIVP